MKKTSAHVLVVTHPFFAGMLRDILESHCTVTCVQSAVEARVALRAKKPSLVVAGDDAVTMAEARELRAAAPVVLVTAQLTKEGQQHLLDLSEADTLLVRPFSADTVAEAVTQALDSSAPRLSQKEQARLEKERAARSLERERWARIALLPLAKLLDLEHPVKDAQEGLISLVRRLGQYDLAKQPRRTAVAALDLCLVTVLWDQKLFSFTDRDEGDLWAETAEALTRTGFRKEAAALRSAFQLLARHGGIEEGWDRFEAREALEGPSRARWTQYEKLIDTSAWTVGSVRKLLTYAKTHLKNLSRIDARR